MRRILRKILLGIGVAGVACVVFRITVYVRAQNVLPHLPGEPTTEEEVKAWHSETVPDAGSAAPLYVKAARAFVDSDFDDEITPFYHGNELPGPRNALPDAMVKSITDFLTKNAETVRLLHEAAAFPKCRFSEEELKDERLRVWRPWPVLALEGVLNAEKGDGNGAADALLAGFAAAGSLREEQKVISVAISWWCGRSLLRALERVLTQVTLTDEQLRAISTALANADTAERMTRGLVGMRCVTAQYFRGAIEIPKESYGLDLPPDLLQGRLRLFYFLSGLADMERRRYNQLIHDWQEARKLVPFSARKDAAMALQERLNNTPDWQKPITRAFIDDTSIVRLVSRETCHKALVATAEMALSIERYRLKYGRLPDKPEELIPEFLQALPADPLNDQPLSYQRDAQGYSVSSVGTETTYLRGDDVKVKGEDIVFTVGR